VILISAQFNISPHHSPGTKRDTCEGFPGCQN